MAEEDRTSVTSGLDPSREGHDLSFSSRAKDAERGSRGK